MTYIAGRISDDDRFLATLLWSIFVTIMIACSRDSVATAEDTEPAPLRNVTYRNHEGETVTTSGRVLITAADGGILLEERDGYLLNIIPEAIIRQEQTDSNFSYLSADELASDLTAEVGTGFRTHKTEHYVLVSELSADYTEWAGALLEQMYGQFFREWLDLEFKVQEPETPLAVLLFQDRARFNAYVKTELLQDSLPNQGFYSVRTNRIVLIDLADGKPWHEVRGSRNSERELAEALLNTSTIVHEGVHQLCYNCGLFNRFADAPLWLSEGIALYFETPSPRSRTGWGGTGRINNSRLFRFRDRANEGRAEDSLKTLIASNEQLEHVDTALDAYSESWLFVSYLMKRKRKDFEKYLQLISTKPPLVFDDPQQRITDFESVFGDNWAELERDFLNYVRRLRPAR
ncbi:MAG: hypothetical protein CMJ46_15810 [Planctomyces sp.]|nr:hypothetical protein [Planctomyces sp.]